MMSKQHICSGPFAATAPIVRAILLTTAMLTLCVAAYAQDKQMIQLKTFDEKLRVMRNVELSINGGEYVSTGAKGAAFVELDASDLPVKSIRIKDNQLEAASWNTSKGTIEIIVRQKSSSIVHFALRLPNGRPVAGTSITFKGANTTTVKTNAAGEFDLELPLQSKASAEQFQIANMKVVRLNLSDKENILVAERTTAADKTTTTRDQLVAFDLSRLDSIQSLTVFYAVFKNVSMSNLSDEARARIDAKFKELVGRMQTAEAQHTDFISSISDSSFVDQDIHNLLNHATRESQALDINRTAFEEKINVITRKLEKGFANMDESTRKSLLSDLDRLEAMLIENESKFYKNQNDYRDIISTLKDKYFDTQSLEQQLSITELKRQEEQRVFQRQILTALAVLIVFGVLIVLLVSFSGRLKQQREALRAANEEIRTINENLEAIVVKRTLSLEESNRELDTFLYRASHDLRSPISSILGLCNIGDKIPTRDFIDRVRGTVLKMDRMLKKLIETSEISQESQKVSEFNVRTAIADIQKALAQYIHDNGVEFHIDCQEDIHVHSNATTLKAILANLIENAVHFSHLRSPDHARVEVKVAAQNNTVNISVYDNGVGIDPTVQPEVFKMFYIGHEKSRGNGLGLYVVKKATQALRGTIEVASEAGKYSKFTIALPRK